MTATLITLASLVLLFFLLARMIANQFSGRVEALCLNTIQSELDIEVLNLLLSRQENRYLRRWLGRDAFLEIRRQRIWLALTYLNAINGSTRRLTSVLQSAQSSEDAGIEQAARELLHIAFRIRLMLPLAQLCLLTEWLFPSLNLAAQLSMSDYREIIGRIVFILGRLQALPSGGILPF